MSVTTQRIQIIFGRVSFITVHNPYASANKTKRVRIETELSFLNSGAGAPDAYVHDSALCCLRCPNTQPFHQFTEGGDSVRRWGGFGKQMRGDQKYPFNGVSKYGKVFGGRVPESVA